MAPTTLPGQVTATTPRGRDTATTGHPIKICELLNALEAPVLLARATLTSPAAVRNAKRLVTRAFTYQMAGRGFALVEVLSPCPTYWRRTPVECMKYIDETVSKTFPLGVVRDRYAEA
jgi:2-oxoglutarate ferredoxin oxidoreductase subunit beta